VGLEKIPHPSLLFRTHVFDGLRLAGEVKVDGGIAGDATLLAIQGMLDNAVVVSKCG
jgi:hypothetical protein